jgi:hypothetical protein
MSRLADQLMAAVGTLNDAGLAGAIGLLAPSLARAECFEMSNDVRSACTQVSKSKPSSVVSALPLTRLPYASTWVEWQGGEIDPDRDPATETKRAPSRMGCLLEAFDPTLSRGLMNWAWSHAGQPPGTALMVLPYSYLFDWHADLQQQINAIVHGELTEEEKRRRLVAAGCVPDVGAMKSLLEWGEASTEDAAAVMRATKRWARLSADRSEQEALIQLEHRGVLQPSIYCARLWAEGPKLVPNFEQQRGSWLEDLEGEVPFMQAFFVMLNAKGAIAAQKDDLSRLNKSRAGKGKPALREFVVTRLNLNKGMVNRAGARGLSREAARLHLVRGHFKVRKTGIYWWSPFPRGRGDVARRERYEVANR